MSLKKADQPYQPNLAAKEAFEEAGLTDEIVPEAVGSFTYEKRLDNCQTVLCKVSVYPFCVTRRLDSWPEQHQWKTRWFALPEAAPVVDESDLAPECPFENGEGEVFRGPGVPRWAGCGPRNIAHVRRPLSGAAIRRI